MKHLDQEIHQLFIEGVTFPEMASRLKLEGEHSVQQLQRYVSSCRRTEPERWPY